MSSWKRRKKKKGEDHLEAERRGYRSRNEPGSEACVNSSKEGNDSL